MSYYDEVLANLQAAEANLQTAIWTVMANRGRGVDESDARSIVEVRDAVHKEYERFRDSFGTSI